MFLTGEAVLFLDLSADPGLFEGPKGDKQVTLALCIDLILFLTLSAIFLIDSYLLAVRNIPKNERSNWRVLGGKVSLTFILIQPFVQNAYNQLELEGTTITSRIEMKGKNAIDMWYMMAYLMKKINNLTTTRTQEVFFVCFLAFHQVFFCKWV